MTDPTTAAHRIRVAIERCFTASPALPTTDDIAAAVLQEAAAVLFPEEPHPTELQRSTTAKGIDKAIDEAWAWSAWLNRRRANERLQTLAQQLNGTDYGDASRWPEASLHHARPHARWRSGSRSTPAARRMSP